MQLVTECGAGDDDLTLVRSTVWREWSERKGRGSKGRRTNSTQSARRADVRGGVQMAKRGKRTDAVSPNDTGLEKRDSPRLGLLPT